MAIALTTLFAGALIGAVTNAVNGAVSPTYFVAVMGWLRVTDVWRAAITQGIFEGLVLGLVLAVVFTSTVGIVTRGACPYRLALRSLAAIAAAACACWVLGGLLGMGLAALSPEFFRHTFFGVPAETRPMLAYAWVGGSIWGLEFGGISCLLIGLVLFRARWFQDHQSLHMMSR